MAKKKVNKKFAMILAVTIVGVTGAGLLGWRYLRPRTTQVQFEQRAQLAIQEGNFVLAFQNFSNAARMAIPPSAEKYTQLGDIAQNAAVQNIELLPQVRLAWQRALEIDPRYAPAIKRLIGLQWAVVRSQPDPEKLAELRKLAESAVVADPNDKRSAAMIPTSTVYGWLRGIETDPTRLAADIDAMGKIVVEDPGDSETAMTLSQALMRQGADLRGREQVAASAEKFKQAAGVFETALAARDQDIGLHQRAAAVYRDLRRFDPPNAKDYDAKLRAVIDRARQLVKPESVEQYLEVSLLAAGDLRERGDREGERKIHERLMELMGNDQVVRLQYAEFLSRDKSERGKAIELLSRPIETAKGNTSTDLLQGVMRNRNLDLSTRIRLSQYRLDAASELAAGSPERAPLLQSVTAEVTRLEQEIPDAVPPMVLRGRLLMLDSRTVEAVQTFGRARTAMERRPERPPEYFDLLMRLSDAYSQSGQTGPARDALRDVISVAPTFIPARALLIQLLAREGLTEEVRREIDAVEKIAPDDPIVKTLRSILPSSNRPDEALANYSKLPETNKRERVTKGRVAIQRADFDDAARLFSEAFSADTTDPEPGLMWVEALRQGGRSDDAKKAMEQVMELHPKNPTAVALRARLSGTPQDAVKAFEQNVEAMAEPFDREMAYYQLAMQRNERDKALERLRKAGAIKPDDRRYLDQMFQHLLVDKNYVEAEKLLPKLVATNADQANGNLYKFRFLLAQNKTEDAIAVGRDLTQKLPQFAMSWLTLGQGLSAGGQHEEALGMYQQALERQGNNVDAIRGLIDSNYRLGRPQEALRALNAAITRFPNDPVFRELMLNHEETFGDAERAMRIREDGAREMMDNPDVLAELARTYVRVGQARLKRGDFPGAKAVFTKAADSYSKVAAARPGDFAVVSLLSRTAAASEEPLKYEAQLKQLTETGPAVDNAGAPLIMVDYYSALGRAEDAEKAVREAVRRGGTSVEPRRMAAQLLSSIQKTDDAVAMIDGAENAAGDKLLQQLRAEILLKAGRFDDAERSVRSMLSKRPEDPELMNFLTVVYVNGKRWPEARKNIMDTLQRNPRDIMALYYRALIELQTNGDVTAAVRDLQVVRDNSQGLSTVMRMVLVEALLRNQDKEGAVREMREAMRFDPDNKTVRLQLVDTLMGFQPKRADESLKVLDDGLQLPQFAGDPELLIVKARVMVARGDTAAAVPVARLAVTNSNRSAGVFRGYVDTLLSAKMAKEVINETDPVLQQTSNPVPYWLRMQRGLARRQLEDREGAVTEFAHAIDIATSGNDETATSQVVASMADALGADEAIKAIAPRLDQDARWRLMSALLEQTRGRLVESLAVLEPALVEAESGKLDANMRARVLRTGAMLMVSPGPQANFDRAVALNRKVIEQFPEDVFTLNNLAYLLTEKVASPNFVEALKFAQQAVDILRKTGNYEPLIFDTYGWALVLNGRVAEGINILNEAVGRRSFVEGHFHLGSAYLKAGDPREAVVQLTRARAMAEVRGADPSYKPRIEKAMEEAQALIKRQQEGGQ
jgi:tetratricopeptide (TPR) repeat protein